MNHCVGGYTVGQQDIYSLRDSSNAPHITIEVSNNEFEQIQGKGNTNVSKKYAKYLRQVFVENKVFFGINVFDYILWDVGLIKSEDNKYYDTDNLPKEPLVFQRDLFLDGCGIKEIPNIICYGVLNLARNLIKEIPENFVQYGEINLEDNFIEEIPKSFKQMVLCI